MKQKELFPQFAMCHCPLHGFVHELEDGTCSYCAVFKCEKHGPYNNVHLGCGECLKENNMASGDFVNCVYCGRILQPGSFFCSWCNGQRDLTLEWPPKFRFDSFQYTTTEQKVRKYLPTLSDLIDRLTIVQQKELKIPEHREEYTKELEDLMHDIQLCLEDKCRDGILDMTGKEIAQMIRDVIVLTLMNCEIWHNESNFRKGIKDGNNLELTHGLNGIRNTAKNKIQEQFGGRKDYKVDNVEAFKNWVPSGYDKK